MIKNMSDNTAHGIHFVFNILGVFAISYLFLWLSNNNILIFIACLLQLAIIVVCQSKLDSVHFKGLIKCWFFSMSTILLICSIIFLMYHYTNEIYAFTLGSLTSIYTAYFLSKESNFKFLYGERAYASKIEDEIDFVMKNFATNKNLIKYEEALDREHDIRYIMIYNLVFKKGIKQNQVARDKEIDVQRVNEIAKTIAHTIRTSYMF